MRRAPDRGMTLIELVVAMSVFALIAVMGLQATSGSLRMRDRLLMVDDDTAQLGFAIALIRADLTSLVPMLFHPPGGRPQSAVDSASTSGGVGLSLAGQVDLTLGGGSHFRRAEWRLDAEVGHLMRRQWSSLYPAQGADVSPEIVVLRDVRGWSLRSYWPELGWIPGHGPEVHTPEPAEQFGDADLPYVSESYSSTLPLAVELRIETVRFGTITIIEALR